MLHTKLHYLGTALRRAVVQVPVTLEIRWQW
jgi:hypothetical protein